MALQDDFKMESQRQAIKTLTSDLVPVLKYDIDELISMAHGKDLIADGLYRQSLGPTPETPSQKTRAFLDAITSRMKLHPPAYDSFMGIIRSFRAFEKIADGIEEQVNILSSTKKSRKIEVEFGYETAATSSEENLPDFELKSLKIEKKESTFYRELETQHKNKPRKTDAEYEYEVAATSSKENLPHLELKSPKLENFSKKESMFYRELETQHKKPTKRLDKLFE